jgi:hypothetical protein
MIKKLIPTHILTLTVGKKLSREYLDRQYFNYILDGKYDKTIPQGDWRSDRYVMGIKTILIERGEMTVVALSGTSDRLYLPIKDFKL